MSKLDLLMKDINKRMDDIIIRPGASMKEYKKIPFSSPLMNYLTYGGIPMGKVTELFGGEGSGKTTSALDISGNAQKQFAEDWEADVARLTKEYEELNAGGKSKVKLALKKLDELNEIKDRGAKKVVYVDLEHTLDTCWAAKLGVDIEELIMLRPELQSAEEVLDIVLELADTGCVGLIVLDSLPMLVPQQILTESMEKKQMGGIAKILADFIPKITPRLTTKEIALIGINQLRDNVSGYGAPTQTSGGRSWKHACSLRIQFSKGKLLDDKMNEVSKACINPYGNIVSACIEKTKVSRPDRRHGSYTLTYYDGICKEYDLVTLALEYGIVVKGGAWFSFVDEEGNILEDEEGVILKFQGLPNTLKYLKAHQDLVTMLDELLKNKYLATDSVNSKEMGDNEN